MAGQVPAISLGAQCHPKRCHRDKPGYDKSMRTRAGNSKVSRLMEFLHRARAGRADCAEADKEGGGGDGGGVKPVLMVLLPVLYAFGMSDRRTFAVVLEPEEEGGFTVRVPAFPEIVTYGKDEREALAMAQDAIHLVIADSVARGDPLPNGEPPRIREVTVTLAA